MRNTDRKMWFFLGSGDIILINFAFVLAYFLKFDTIALKENYIFLLLVFNFSWILVSAMFSLYTFSRVDHLEHIVSNNLDLGDIIGCKGEVFLTKTNELIKFTDNSK